MIKTETDTAINQPVPGQSPANSADQPDHPWRRLGMRIRSITPSGLMRFALLMLAVFVIGWFIKSTWVSLIPFVIGTIIAYILLPLVNWLDGWIPRWVAVFFSLTLALAAVVVFIALLAPTITEQFYRIYLVLPNMDEIRSYLTRIEQYVASLPAPAQEAIYNLQMKAIENFRANTDTYLTGLVTLAITTLFGVINTVSFVLGFLVVPAWLLTILQEQRKGSEAFKRLLPAWMRPDVLAVLRIFNRTFSAFLRGQMLMALVAFALTYLGLEIIVRLFGLANNVRYELLLAVIAGVMQLIPTIGPFLGVIPAVLVGLQISMPVTIAIIIIYVAIQLIITNFISPQVERSIIDIHPAILLVVMVALSEFGILWVLLAAPVTAIVRDLFRYTYGRFSNPPRPAGVLPGETYQPEVQPQTTLAAKQRLPLVYRRGRTVR